MNEFYSYLVQSGVNLIILFGIYWLFLRRDTLYNVNRYYLLISLIVSFIFPLIEISVPGNGQTEYMYLLEAIVITPDKLAASMPGSITMSKVLFIFYIAGSGFFLARLVYQLLQTALLIQKYGITYYNGVKMVIVDNEYVPFSLFNLVFINREETNKPYFEKIIEHEKAHVRQHHTLDLIVLELFLVIQWFNPFIWFYRKSLKSIHEYLADESVLSKGYSLVEYQQLLLNQTLGIQFSSLSNNFNHSLIKNRFIMMSKEKSKRAAMLKMVFIIPVAIVFTLIFTITFAENIIAQSDSHETAQIAQVQKVEKSTLPSAQDDPIFAVVEKMPEFPGGKDAFTKYLVNNIKYPENARKNGIHGRVFVTFVVEKNGKITGIRVIRGVDEELDKEAVRVVSEMPKWKPGIQKGNPVRVQFNVPIVYRLDSDKDTGVEKTVMPKRYEEIKNDKPGTI